MQLQLNFGGFYESIWDHVLESEVECRLDEIDCQDEAQAIRDSINWKATYVKASEYITKLFNQAMLDYGYNIDVQFDILFSPKFYNFETDVIILKNYDLDTLENALVGVLTELDLHDEYEELFTCATTSRSGYIAFYSADTIEQDHRVNLMIGTLFLDDRFRDKILDGLSMYAHDTITMDNDQ